jgi:signal transduction histidine kinase
VFHNLARNAVEAMPEGGKLRVQVDKVGEQLQWTVSDSGPGIPQELRGRLFELFATGKKGGTGLGLAIVKKIVDDHHGTVECVSDPDGTTFTVRMPLARPTDGD